MIQVKKLKVIFSLNPVTLLCNYVWELTIVTNIEKSDISGNLTSDISNSTDFRIDGSISVNNDRKDYSTNSDNIDYNSNWL